MTEYLMVETGGRWAGPSCARFVRDALRLAGGGARVSLFLLEDGVSAAVGDPVPGLTELLGLGGRVWVDEFSLRRRALARAPLVPGVERTDLDRVAERLLDPAVRAVWH